MTSTASEDIRLLLADVDGTLVVWIYRGADWFVRDLEAPHIARKSFTVRFDPTLVDDFDGMTEGIAKLVGVSDDHELLASTASAAHDEFGDHVSAARSQPCYLDVTHPEANKGAVVKFLGQSGREVHRAARVRTSNEEDGFAYAVEHLVLRAHHRATLKSTQRR